MCHPVVGSSQFEAEHRLEVFPLEKDFAFQSIANIYSWGEGSLFDNFVYSGSED